MLEQLDLSESVEKKVRDRYISLSNWFGRENSSIKDIEINIFSQGSFALGTTIKPIREDEEYDLDMGCKLNIVGYKKSHSQEELKKIVGRELELYRKNVHIQKPLIEKRRCWRLEYKDEVAFHLDVVPCIPLEDESKEIYFSQLMEQYKQEQNFIDNVAHLAVNITDNEKDNYSTISTDWNISNSQGYVQWFQNRMKHNVLLETNSKTIIEPVPYYPKKSILQRCIQLLKRHRDSMFQENRDSKPISVIITTLAARAYNGEQNMEAAIMNILENMPRFISSNKPRIPNPVKPEEDFTDRWDNPMFSHLNLEINFKAWLRQASMDFKKIFETEKSNEIHMILNEKFSLNIPEERLQKEFGYNLLLQPTTHVINTPTIRPWKS